MALGEGKNNASNLQEREAVHEVSRILAVQDTDATTMSVQNLT